jgi:hypothetical protein
MQIIGPGHKCRSFFSTQSRFCRLRSNQKARKEEREGDGRFHLNADASDSVLFADMSCVLTMRDIESEATINDEKIERRLRARLWVIVAITAESTKPHLDIYEFAAPYNEELDGGRNNSTTLALLCGRSAQDNHKAIVAPIYFGDLKEGESSRVSIGTLPDMIDYGTMYVDFGKISAIYIDTAAVPPRGHRKCALPAERWSACARVLLQFCRSMR